MERNNLFPLPGVVRPAEDLEALAKRVREREKKSRSSQLEHAKRQAADVLAARGQAKRGQWKPWCEKAGLSEERALQFSRFGKTIVTTVFQALSEDEQWEEWQRISGNASSDDEEAADEVPEYVTLSDWNELPTDARERLLTWKGDRKFNEQDSDKIEWALWSWNPVSGCLHNCPYCYARDRANRFYVQKFVPSLYPDRLSAPQNT